MKKLSCMDEPTFDLRLILLISNQRKIQERMTISTDRWQILSRFIGLLRLPAFLTSVEERDCLQEIGIGNVRNDARSSICGTQRLYEAALSTLRFFAAEPVLSKFMSFRRVHRGNEFECVKRLAASIDLFKHNAHRFLRCGPVQCDDRDPVVLEVLQNR